MSSQCDSKKSKLCVSLFDSDIAILRTLAEREERDVGYFVRHAVRDYVTSRKIEVNQ